jgi:hypothetical protein
MCIEVMFLQQENTYESSTIYTFSELWDSLENAIKYASKQRIEIISYKEVPQT